MNEVKIFPLGLDALTVEFGNEISVALNRKVLKLSRYFQENQFEGFVETVPAYASLTIFYDVLAVKKKFPDFATAFAAVKSLVENALANLTDLPESEPRLIEIAVAFDKESALDLEFVAEVSNLSPQEVVEIFTAKTYRVFMVGFLPGFAYMGEVDNRIAAPRKASPRLKVPKGSVGIAGRQTGIYSLDAPGGWQIIGRTAQELFTPAAKNPCLLQTGDLVKFVAA